MKFTCKNCGKNYKTIAFDIEKCFYCDPVHYQKFFTKLSEKR